MNPPKPRTRALWSSRLAFVLAATGAAIGLGNIWRFPYVAGENGGGAFVLVYLLCIILVGIPILVAETMVGRSGGANPARSLAVLARRFSRSRHWKAIGWLALIGSFAILSYYSVIAGWTLAYIFRSAGGLFSGATIDGTTQIFNDLVRDPEKLVAWYTLFLLITAVVVGAGVNRGIERIAKWFIPILLLILIFLVGYVAFESDILGGLDFLFSFKFDQLSVGGVLAAMGQAFLSLGIGFGANVVYGSYLSSKISIVRTVSLVAILDTLVALVAGVVVFSLVSGFGLDPAGGPGLVFRVLPLAFGQIAGGAYLGALFYFLLMVAAWTSAISLLEPGVSWCSERFAVSRIRATVIVSAGVWVLGLATVFSFALPEILTWGERTLFDWLDFLAINIVLPVGGILIVFFVAWKMPKTFVRGEIGARWGWLRAAVFQMMRYIAPLGVLAVLIYQIYILF